MLISPGYAEDNADLHDRVAGYGSNGQRWAGRVREILARTGGRDVLDYGCGKGTLAPALSDVPVQEYDPGVPGKDALPAPADVVVCTDVLEHIEPDCLGDVLEHLATLARRAAFLNISTRPAAKVLRDGRNAHLIVEGAAWWRALIDPLFVVEEWEVGADEVNGVVRPRPHPEGAGVASRGEGVEGRRPRRYEGRPEPMGTTMQNAEIAERRSAAIARGVGMATQVYVERAENAEVWDVEGRRFIDFAGGIAVVNTGHRHPKVMEAVRAQLDSFTHTCHQVLPYESYVRLGERLNALVPGPWDKRTLFVTTGAEAVENAVKVARIATGRSAVIAFGGAFHGRTFMGMSLTGKVQPYKAGFGPMMPDVYHVPFPVALHGTAPADALAGVAKLFKADLDPARVAAVIIEPVQGEGGFYPAPAELMRGLRALCDEHGIALIADEVQTGFARTGKLFAMEHYDVAADLVCMAKALAGGLPLAAVTGRADLMDAASPGGLGGTYGGNPLGIAAAHAVLDVIEEEDLCARANLLGSRLRQRLEALRERVPEMAEVRGPGFMVAVEFNRAGADTPDPDLANRIRTEALSRGLILLTCGVYANVIRFLAPITIPDEVFSEAMDILEESVMAARAVPQAA